MGNLDGFLTIADYNEYTGRMPSTALFYSAVTGPAGEIHYDFPSCRYHGETRWPIRSHGQRVTCAQPPIYMTQIELSITKLTRHSHPILNNHAYRLWSLHASRCPNSAIYWPAPGRCNWWTHSLKIKYISVIFSRRQRMARFTAAPRWYPMD
jgi:hypothetical protein